MFTREFHVAHVHKRISCFQHLHLWCKKNPKLRRVKRTLSFIYLLDMFFVGFFAVFYFYCGGQKFILSGLSIYHPWQEALLSWRFFLLFYFNNTQQSHAKSLWAVCYLTGDLTSPLQRLCSLTSASKCTKSPLFSLDLIWMYTTFNFLH